MESTYGSDMEFGRMFDQYMHKGNQNFDLSLSIPNTNSHLSYMAEQANSYAPYESRGTVPPPSAGNPPESYTDLSALHPHEATHPPHSVVPHNLQTSHPHQNMYQMGVASLHDGSVQFPPQNLYIPPISQPGHGLVPQSGGYLGPGLNHPSLVYTNANLHPQAMMGPTGGMIHNPYFPRQQMIRSGSSPTSAGGSPSPGSEDSDDSNNLAQPRMKRPSPDVLPEAIAPTKGKKARVSKKSKKKKDPNEPQKPVSAYALFFRDTQASIKGENPNASFGEVSKIVASMWDSLDSDNKSAYKRKTEAAKKEYLKKLAAYRATLVSQGEGDPVGYNQSTQPYGQLQPPPNYGFPVTTSAGQIAHPRGHSPPQLSMPKKSPLLNSLMTPDAQQSLMNPPMSQPMPPSAPSMMAQMGNLGPPPMTSQCPPQSNHQAMVQGPHLSQMNPGPPSPYMTQANPSLSSPVSSMGSDVGSPVGHTMHNTHQQPQQLSPHAAMPQQSPHANMQQHSPPQHQNHHTLQNQAPVNHQPQNQGSGPIQVPRNQGSGPLQVPSAPQMCNGSTCLRSGCNNPAVNNPEWEEEYCSNECVVSHCRDVFGTWVAGNQQNTPIYPAPVK